MGFIDNETMVRVDIFKESGKWYDTVAITFDTYSYKEKGETIHETFRRCMKDQINRYEGMTAICLEPYHESAHPLMIKL